MPPTVLGPVYTPKRWGGGEDGPQGAQSFQDKDLRDQDYESLCGTGPCVSFHNSPSPQTDLSFSFLPLSFFATLPFPYIQGSRA